MILLAQTDWGAWVISTLSLLSTAAMAEWKRRSDAKAERDKAKALTDAEEAKATALAKADREAEEAKHKAAKLKEEADQRDYLFKQHQEFVEQLKIERIEDKKVIADIQREHVNCQLTVATLTERVALLEKFSKKENIP